MPIEAKVLADSKSADGNRLVSIQAKMHRFVLAELNTHRVFSRNSASSRAIPVPVQIQRLEQDLAMPLEYRYNQSGMQAAGLMSDEDASLCEGSILELSKQAIRTANLLASVGPEGKNGKPVGLHKQWANRYLEPWMWHEVIITSMEWDNFFAQRSSKFSPLAQPEFRKVADLIHEVISDSTPQELSYGEWHTPYIKEEDIKWALEGEEREGRDHRQTLTMISAARCARVSYLTQEKIRDPREDLNMYARLVSANPPHWSPLEHVATPFYNRLLPLGNFIKWDIPSSREELSSLGRSYYSPSGFAQLRHNTDWFDHI